MKAGWDTVSLGDVCAFQGGTQPPKSQFVDAPKDGYVRLLQIRDFKSDDKAVFVPDNGKVKKCEPDDIMIGRYGASVGQIHRGKGGAYNVALVKTIPDSRRLDRDYFYHYLTSDLFQRPLMAKSSRGAQNGFNQGDISPFPVPLPPLEEQKRIVAVLDAAFEGLTRARAHVEANLLNAQELFERSSTELLASQTASHSMVELEEVANLDRGHNPPKKDFIYQPKEGYVRFYQIRDRKSDDHAVYVPETPKLHRVGPDEILMSAYRHIGEVFRGAEGAFNVALCKLSSRSEQKMLNDYLFAIIPTDFVKGELLRHSERSLIPSMSVKHLQKIKIPLPDVEEQKVMVEKLELLRSQTDRLKADFERKRQELDDLRQSLLQKAFAGELT